MFYSQHRGREANTPTDIPLIGWWDIVRRLFVQIDKDNLSLISAGVAFYFLLAIFPAIAALLSCYGLFNSVEEASAQVQSMINFLPQETHALLLQQVTTLAAKSETTLSVSAISSTLLAIWSSSRGADAIITACNITYRQEQERSFFMKLLMRMAFTAAAIGFVFVALSVIAILPIVLNLLGVAKYLDWLLTSASWPLLAVFFNLAMMAIYRFGPHRRAAKWRWTTPGALIATTIWIVASAGFSFYVSNYGSYNETYGSLGGVVILLMWLYLTAFIILLGAEFNAATELQTRRDSTVGPPRDIGQRGAYVADTVASTPNTPKTHLH